MRWMWLAAMLLLPCAVAPAREAIAPDVYRRTVFLGDSITDGNTYPALVRDALADAGLPKMTAINAGIGGDTAKGMRARLERDVLAFHPTLVTLSAGANDTLHGVSPAEYEKDVRAIAERLKEAHVPLILLTPNILGPKQQRGRKGLEQYETILRQVARDYALRVAEVNRRQNEDLSAGHAQLAADDLHPNYEGQRMIARAVLDAMGYEHVKVPARAHNEPLPGVIREWKMKPLGEKDAPLGDGSVRHLTPDDSWITLTLPETEPDPRKGEPDQTWLDDYRMMGVSISLARRSSAKKFVGLTTLHADAARTVQFHTGAELDVLWLNGHRIYRNDGSRGWHPGRESVTAQLVAGQNRLVIQTGTVFFLSMTDGPLW